MRKIMVVPRNILFPGTTPTGLLPVDRVDYLELIEKKYLCASYAQP